VPLVYHAHCFRQVVIYNSIFIFPEHILQIVHLSDQQKYNYAQLSALAVYIDQLVEPRKRKTRGYLQALLSYFPVEYGKKGFII